MDEIDDRQIREAREALEDERVGREISNGSVAKN
jgi:hypothetical protein